MDVRPRDMKALTVPFLLITILGCAAARRIEMERLHRESRGDVRPEDLSDLQKDIERLAGRIKTPEEKARMARLFLQLGRALRKNRRFEAAMSVQRRVAREFGEEFWKESHLEMAETCQYQGDLDGAVEVLRLLESSRDGCHAPVARLHLAGVELKRSRPEAALELMESVAADSRDRESRSSAVLYLASHFGKGGDLRKALHWWKVWDPYSQECGTYIITSFDKKVMKVAEIHVRLGEIDLAVAELRARVAAPGFLPQIILSYIETVGKTGNLGEEYEKVGRLSEPGRRRCRAALQIREGFLAGNPKAVYDAPVEEIGYQAAGILLGKLGDRAAEFLSLRILQGDRRAIRLAYWTGLTSLLPALEARLDREDDPLLQYQLRMSLYNLRLRAAAAQ